MRRQSARLLFPGVKRSPPFRAGGGQLMAMIMCPECRKMVSDKAAACPRCGCPIASLFSYESQTPPVSPVLPRRTELGPLRTDRIGGVIFVVIGIIGLPFGLMAGIVGVIFPIVFIIFGGMSLVGDRKGTCPYCGASVSVAGGSENYRCHTCKNLCVVKGDFLEEVPR